MCVKEREREREGRIGLSVSECARARGYVKEREREREREDIENECRSGVTKTESTFIELQNSDRDETNFSIFFSARNPEQVQVIKFSHTGCTNQIITVIN
jgi:hypothetical protein